MALAMACIPTVGCTPDTRPAPPTTSALPSAPKSRQPVRVVGTPPVGDGRTLLVIAATRGSSVATSVRVGSGDLWLTGRCADGTVRLHIDPLAVLPIPCEDMAGVPFANQLVINSPATYQVWVEAPAAVTWNLRVEQSRDTSR
ncbi:hypothetical protein [Micromonospora chersina]